MHYSVLYWLLFAVSTVNVAASPIAVPVGSRCLPTGEGCWKEKRAAEPEPEPVAGRPKCLATGEGCWKEKRAAEPEPKPVAGRPKCLATGEGCWKGKRAAEPEPEAALDIEVI